jgi:hypothetical protein
MLLRFLLPLAVAAAYAVTVGTHDAPLAGWNGFVEYEVPYTAPHMTAADQAAHPTCSTVPALTETTLIEREDATVEQVKTAKAYRLAQAGEVWIIGYCS